MTKKAVYVVAQFHAHWLHYAKLCIDVEAAVNFLRSLCPVSPSIFDTVVKYSYEAGTGLMITIGEDKILIEHLLVTKACNESCLQEGDHARHYTPCCTLLRRYA